MISMIKDGKEIAGSIQTCILYDKRGNVVHRHQVVTFPGGRRINQSQMESRTLELAARAKGEVSGLKAIHVKEEEYDPSKLYKVDVKSKRLIEQAMPKKVRQQLEKLRSKMALHKKK